MFGQIRDALSASGLDASKYSGHSFRSGAATTALDAGISDATIQMLGRWRSDAYKRYIKTPKEHLATFSAQLAKQQLLDYSIYLTELYSMLRFGSHVTILFSVQRQYPVLIQYQALGAPLHEHDILLFWRV